MRKLILGQAVKTITTAGTPVRLSATTQLVRWATLYGRASTSADNAADIHYGLGSNTLRGIVAPGQAIPIPGDGKWLDLYEVWVDGTNGDGVSYDYAQ